MIPIWWCLKPKDRDKLKKYQQEEYGFNLEIPPVPKDKKFNTEWEPLEEIDQLIRKPSRFKRAGYEGR